MKIRTAVESDLQEIVRAENACFPQNEAASERDVRERLRVYPNHFWLMYEDERLVSFVNGLATNQPDLTDEMYKNACLHNEGGAWQMIFGVGTVPDQRRRRAAQICYIGSRKTGQKRACFDMQGEIDTVLFKIRIFKRRPVEV